MMDENPVGSESPSTDVPSYEPRRRYPLHVKILIGLATGALLGSVTVPEMIPVRLWAEANDPKRMAKLTKQHSSRRDATWHNFI